MTPTKLDMMKLVGENNQTVGRTHWTNKQKQYIGINDDWITNQMEDSYKKLKIKKRTLWVKIENNEWISFLFFCTKGKKKRKKVYVCL
jgi:hypothetical protein